MILYQVVRPIFRKLRTPRLAIALVEYQVTRFDPLATFEAPDAETALALAKAAGWRIPIIAPKETPNVANGKPPDQHPMGCAGEDLAAEATAVLDGVDEVLLVD